MTVKFETLFNGYVAAHSRFDEVRIDRDTEATFHSLFEALNWAVAMDDHIRLHWKPEGDQLGWKWRDYLDEKQRAAIKGIRFVRNRVHHQWADALQLDTGGLQFPAVFPLVFHEWSWTSAEKIPPGNDDRGIDDYRSTLQGKPARLSLSVLGQVYRAMAAEHLD